MPHRFRTWTKPKCTCQSRPTHLRHGFLAYLLLRANPVVSPQSNRRDAVLQGREAHLAPWGGLGALLLLSRLPQHVHKLPPSHPLAVPSTDIYSRCSLLPIIIAREPDIITYQAGPPFARSRYNKQELSAFNRLNVDAATSSQPTICTPSPPRLCVPLS